MRGAFSASTKLCASEVISMPEPLPSLLIIPDLTSAALLALVELVLEVLVLEPEVLVVPLEEPVAVDVVDDVTEVTILLL